MKTRSFSRLSAVQIKKLCTLASAAFKLDQQRGGVEDGITADHYRKIGQMEAAGIESLKDARQDHYLPLLGKWFTVLGRLDEAFYAYLYEGAANEARRQMAWRLMGQVAHLAEAIGERHLRETGITLDAPETARQAWAYTKHLAKEKYAGQRIEELDETLLEQLGFTVVNRTTAKRGQGDSRTRNKSQRATPRPVPENDLPYPPRLPTSGLSLVDRAKARLAP